MIITIIFTDEVMYMITLSCNVEAVIDYVIQSQIINFLVSSEQYKPVSVTFKLKTNCLGYFNAAMFFGKMQDL